MRQLDILGIRLRDYSLREGLKKACSFMDNGALSAICYLSDQTLVKAAEEPRQQEWIEQMDMTVFGTTDILKAAGIESRGRIRDVEENTFFREFIRRSVREQRTFFLVAGTPQMLEKLEAYVRRAYEKEPVVIAGSYLLSQEESGADSLVNEVNDVAPDIVISCLPFAQQAGYMNEYRKMMNARIWLGMLEEQLVEGDGRQFFRSVRQNYLKRMFRYKISKYEQEKNHE